VPSEEQERGIDDPGRVEQESVACVRVDKNIPELLVRDALLDVAQLHHPLLALLH
jgi:hypothetical protein